MAETIRDFLTRDHRRLDALLDEATATPGHIEAPAFDLFRRGLLRHIGMEEKIVWPAARETLGVPVSSFDRLRADHGRLVALLVPTPTPLIAVQIRAILTPHNELEEASGGVYEECTRHLSERSADLIARLHAAPEVPVRPHLDRSPPRRG